MKVEEIDGAREQDILVGMIVSNSVCARIAGKWERGLFRSPLADDVAKECTLYYDQHNSAPGKNIEPLMRAWALKHQREEDRLRRVEDLLRYLSERYEQLTEDINPEFIIDLAGRHFRTIRTERALEEAKALLLKDRLEEAESVLTGYTRVELGSEAGVRLLSDAGAQEAVFDPKLNQGLIDYPGAAGDMLNPVLERDCFVAFCAPQKSTKSVWLLDMAYRAMCARRRVLYIQVGDLTQRQIHHRLLVRMAGHPSRSPGNRWPYSVKVPTKITFSKKAGTVAEFAMETFKKPLGLAEAQKAIADFKEQCLRSDRDYLSVQFKQSLSVNVLGIRDIIDREIQEGFQPAVVCLDYADNLAPCNTKLDYRHQINDTWNRLRVLAAEKHVLLLTATQVKAEGYDAKYLTRRHFSEDNRKLNHVTAMLGINMSETEKENQLARLNVVALREGDFSPRRWVHVATCLPFMDPCVVSAWPREGEGKADLDGE